MDIYQVEQIVQDHQNQALQKEVAELKAERDRQRSILYSLRTRTYVKRMYALVLTSQCTCSGTDIDPFGYDWVGPEPGDTEALIAVLNEIGCDVDDEGDGYLAVWWGVEEDKSWSHPRRPLQ